MSRRPSISTARLEGRSAVLSISAIVAALLVAAAGVAVIQQSLVSLGVLTGDGWALTTLTWLDGLTRGVSVAIGAGVALLGLLLIWFALRAGRSRESELPARTGLVIGHGDVARLASAAARTVGGVLTAGTVATRRRVSVHVTSTGSGDVAQRVEAAVGRTLGEVGIDRKVEVSIDVPSGHGGRSAPAAPASDTAAAASLTTGSPNRDSSEVPHA